MSRAFIFCVVISTLSLSVSAQVAPEPMTLVPGQPVEREIAGGESHAYHINLTAGQFARFRLKQQGVDAVLILTAPDGKQLTEMNLTGAGEYESLSLEAAVAGSYRLTVRVIGAPTLRGSYHLEASVQAETTAQDRKRLMAEALLVEVLELRKPGRNLAQQAVEKAEQALPLWRDLDEPFWTAHCLFLIGSLYYDLNQIVKAIEYYEQALPIYRGLKHKGGEGSALSNLGVAYKDLGRPEKSIEYYEQALTIQREIKSRAGEGMVLNNLGGAYRSQGHNEKAIEYYEQALAIYREVKDRKGEGDALNNLGSAYTGLGHADKAIENLEQALAIYRELKYRLGEGLAHNGLGVLYRNLGRNDEAIEHLKQSLAIFRELKYRSGEAIVLNGLGAMYLGFGQNEQAMEHFEGALAIYRELKNRRDEAVVFGNLGAVFIAMGQTEKAVEHFEQALLIQRELKNRPAEARMLNNLGSAYARVNRNEKAIEYYQQALAIYREVKNRQGEASALNNLGDGYNHLGQYAKAIEYLDQVLVLSREMKSPQVEAVALGNLGDAYAPSKRYDRAIEYYERALAIHREVKNRREEVVTLTSLGNMQRQLGQKEKAAESCAQALAILREIGASDLEVGTLYALAQTERARGNEAQAQTLMEESLRIAESMRADLVSPESRTAFLTTVQSSYQLYTDILMSRHQAEPTQGFAALAVETSERQRARSLLDLLTEARADLRRDVDAALIERERSLGRELNDKAQRLTQANKPEQSAALKQEISQLENDYERAQAAIRKNNPHYAALVQPQPLKLTEIQQQLDADTLLLEYALGEEHSYLWAITKDSLTSYELAKGEQIKQSALQVYELLTTRSTSERGEIASERQARIIKAEAALPSAAQSLSDILLAPVAAQLGNKRLVIVGDGALQYIPFAMLPEPRALDFGLRSSPNSSAQVNNPRPQTQGPKTKDLPLIVKHEIISLPSASALAIQRAELAGRQPAPRMLAVIADPVFDRSDSRFTTPATEGSDRTKPQTIGADDLRSIEHLAEHSADKSGVTNQSLVIPRLPFTRQEANQLMALAPKGSSFSAIDFQASRTTALDPALGQYRYLHFATHGYLDSERPGLSALLFSMVDAQGKPQDGFLRANDIYNLKLPAELVVLSACQTGLGKDIKGEGLVGLTRGFMYAGAARVVVSLWNVNDKATADLMTKFYEKMLKQGQRPAAALRSAQVEMWRQKQWQSPYYWAAFTMQGEWR